MLLTISLVLNAVLFALAFHLYRRVRVNPNLLQKSSIPRKYTYINAEWDSRYDSGMWTKILYTDTHRAGVQSEYIRDVRWSVDMCKTHIESKNTYEKTRKGVSE